MSALPRPQPRPGVLDIEAYVPGKSTAPGVARVFKLSSNETPLGPSPKAIAAYRGVAEHLEDYPDGAATDLREAIGRAYGLDPARIVCGAGSDDLLNLLARAYLSAQVSAGKKLTMSRAAAIAEITKLTGTDGEFAGLKPCDAGYPNAVRFYLDEVIKAGTNNSTP